MIKVLKAGLYASIQDKGRTGFTSYGVPISGVMDSYSANIANSVLDNALDSAVLEITFGGTQLQFLQKSFICISGADFSAKINGELILLNSRIPVFNGDVLSFDKVIFGVRSYLAVKDGFITDKILGSRSFYQNITVDLVITKNAILPIKKIEKHSESTHTSIKVLKSHFESKELECFKGPEFDLLTKYQKEKICNQNFTISNDNSRMGYRLNEIIDNNLSSILTSSVLPGTVQLTPSGKLIVLMKDCQVTGGYPRVLQLNEKAIYKLAQKTTNDRFKFILESL